MTDEPKKSMFDSEPQVEVSFITFKNFGPLSWKKIQECAAKHGEETGEYILRAIRMRMQKEKDFER